jgi:hypothetical protein
MKKTLIALAAVAVSGAAFAQATITGNVSVGVQNTVADQGARFNLTNADVTVAASEDLGGGMKAAVAMTLSSEGQRSNAVTVDAVTASLSGAFGSLAYANVLSGSAKLSAGVSAEDDMTDAIGAWTGVSVVTYTLPQLAAGFTAALEFAGANGTAMESAGKAAINDFKYSSQLKLNVDPTVVVKYNAGPASVYFDYPTADSNDWDLRVTYDLGVAKVGVRTTGSTTDTQELTVTAPMGAANVGYHYAKSAAGTGNGYTASYALSKRTSVSASFVQISKKSVAADNGNNYRVQLSHSF